MPGQYRGDIGAGARASDQRRAFESIDGGNAPSVESMRLLRRLHANPVTVLTTLDATGFRGITVSAFCVVSLEPGRVLACLGAETDLLAAIESSGAFAVSLLSDEQEFLADRFAGRAPLVNPRFTGVKHRLTRQGNPVLEDCLAWFDCTVERVEPRDDHTIVFGAVREAGYGAGVTPLLYFDGRYRFVQVE